MIAARCVVVLAMLASCSRRETSSPAPAEASVARNDPAPVEAKVEPAPKVVEPEPEKVEPDAKVEPEPAPTGGSIDDARGLSSKEVVARWGEPDRKEGARWTYVFPRPPSCTDREIVYVLRMKRDEVASVERSTRQTGKVCEGDLGM